MLIGLEMVLVSHQHFEVINIECPYILFFYILMFLFLFSNSLLLKLDRKNNILMHHLGGIIIYVFKFFPHYNTGYPHNLW